MGLMKLEQNEQASLRRVMSGNLQNNYFYVYCCGRQSGDFFLKAGDQEVAMPHVLPKAALHRRTTKILTALITHSTPTHTEWD